VQRISRNTPSRKKGFRRRSFWRNSSHRKQIAAAFRSILRKSELIQTDLASALPIGAMRMQVRTVVVAPLAITFAVCEDIPLVFIKSGSKLD
jgi:hypothetical protein